MKKSGMEKGSATDTHEPAAIAAIIALEVVGGIGSLVLGAIFLVSGTTSFGALFLIIGALAFVVVRGFQSGRGYAWPLAMALSAMGTLVSIFGISLAVMDAAMVGGLVYTGPISAIIISLVTIYYLTRPHVRTYRK